MIIVKEFTFHAAHFLPDHPRCGAMHGHTYRVQVGISGLVDLDSGMVMDFAEIRDLYGEAVELVDHDTLNDVLPAKYLPPTAENLAIFFSNRIRHRMADMLLASRHISIAFVKVWETPTAYALWTNGTFGMLAPAL